MLFLLEEKGELENIIVIIILDNGMVFFFVKVNLYEYGIYILLIMVGLGIVKNEERK